LVSRVRHGRVQVVAHQVELVARFLAGWKADFGRGRANINPAVTRVDRVEAEVGLEEIAVGFGISGVDDDVGAGDHACSLGGV